MLLIIFVNFYSKSLFTYRKVASSRPVYYSILDLFGQSIKFPLHKPSENLKTETCYYSRLYGITKLNLHIYLVLVFFPVECLIESVVYSRVFSLIFFQSPLRAKKRIPLS